MRVLFDHNLPHKLRTSLDTLSKHEFVTASYMGWGDLKNGELLRIAEESGIKVLITGDQSLLNEQNLAGRRLAIVALLNEWPIVKNTFHKFSLRLTTPSPVRFRQSSVAPSAGRKPPASKCCRALLSAQARVSRSTPSR